MECDISEEELEDISEILCQRSQPLQQLVTALEVDIFGREIYSVPYTKTNLVLLLKAWKKNRKEKENNGLHSLLEILFKCVTSEEVKHKLKETYGFIGKHFATLLIILAKDVSCSWDSTSKLDSSTEFPGLYRASFKDRLVVIRVLNERGKMMTKSDVDMFEKEAVECYKMCGHNGTLEVLALISDSNVHFPLYGFVLEYMALGSLRDFMIQNAKSITLEEKLHWLYDICGTMQYIYSHANIKYQHRDLNLDNILVNEGRKVKVG